MRKILKVVFSRDILYITLFVYLLMSLGSAIPFKFSILNPFKQGLKDYDVTDLVFSKFIDKNSTIDDRITLVNVGKPDRLEIIDIIEKIQKYNPVAVGIDIHFEDFSETATDTLLRTCLVSHPNIVVIKRIASYDVESNSITALEGCHPFFCDSLKFGLSNFLAVDGEIIRNFSTSDNYQGNPIWPIGVELAQLADSTVKPHLERRNNKQEIINYIGTEDAFISIDKQLILDGDADLTNTFQNKIVLLGYLGADDWSESIKDKFYTPLNPHVVTRGTPDLYGVVIHANIVSMLLNKDYINIPPKWICWLINFLLIFTMTHFFRQVYLRVNSGYWKIVKVFQVMLCAFLFLIVSGVMYFYNYKLLLGVGIIGAILSWDMIKIYENIILKKQKFLKPKSPKQ